ncbi:MAG: hypothetical protein ABSA46_16275 [Thermodesulfovibrionales bacterium]
MKEYQKLRAERVRRRSAAICNAAGDSHWWDAGLLENDTDYQRPVFPGCKELETPRALFCVQSATVGVGAAEGI